VKYFARAAIGTVTLVRLSSVTYAWLTHRLSERLILKVRQYASPVMKMIGSTMAEAFFASNPCSFTTDVARPWVRSANRGFGAGFLLLDVLGDALGDDVLADAGDGSGAGTDDGDGAGTGAAGVPAASGWLVPHPPATRTSTTARSFRFTVA
jgi:hypothetical protein